jgi:predicted regulator of Ras-like GTPase activity (Roadblock/LC7/MglB family)
MLNLPSLIDEDIAALDAALGDFVAASRARLAMFVDGGGFIVTRHGDEGEMDLATLGALAANSFAATQAIAKIIHEDSVTSLYQEGVQNSLLILSGDVSVTNWCRIGKILLPGRHRTDRPAACRSPFAGPGRRAGPCRHQPWGHRSVLPQAGDLGWSMYKRPQIYVSYWPVMCLFR